MTQTTSQIQPLVNVVDRVFSKGNYLSQQVINDREIEEEMNKIKKSSQISFVHLAADLVKYYASSNKFFDKTMRVLNALRHIDSLTDVQQQLLKDTDFERLTNIIDGLYPHDNDFFKNLCLLRKNEVVAYLFHLSQTNEFFFLRFCDKVECNEIIQQTDPSTLPLQLMDKMIAHIDSDTRVKWILSASVEQQGLWINRLNKKDVTRSVIEKMDLLDFQKLAIHLCILRSPTILTLMRFCSEDQFEILLTMPNPIRMFEFNAFDDKDRKAVFEFLLKLPKNRREQLYNAPLLENGLSVRKIIESVSGKLTHAVERKIVLIPPLLLVGCYISLNSVLKLITHLTSNQLAFIAFYGRKSAVLRLMSYCTENNHTSELRMLNEGLPHYPILHQDQLTQKHCL